MDKHTLKPGLYEQIINEKIADDLSELPEACKETADLDEAEASRALSSYLQKILQKKLDEAAEHGGLLEQVNLTNKIINLLPDEKDRQALSVEQNAQKLLALLSEQDERLAVGKTAKSIPRPETSIAHSSLFTGAKHEPQLFSEFCKEILSCSRIDLLVSFIKWTGMRLIMDQLRAFTQNGGHLRIITTTYLGASDSKAIEELAKLPNTQIRISYNTQPTRMHAKAYIFYRETGFSTAYIGSSNMSKDAMTSGLEWNLKITATDQPDTMRKIRATFESYWNSDEFEAFDVNAEEDRERLHAALSAEKYHFVKVPAKGSDSAANAASVFTIRPYTFQQQILDLLQAEREVRHEYKNLVVAATGTGKTVIAAFDYRNFCHAHPQNANRLLFVAHREELLLQARNTFCGILKDPNFGEILDSHYKPESASHLFASIQSLNSRELCEKLPADYYDYIVVDEFHHAAAPSYQQLLGHFQPKILLGLTATPERMDGKSILDYFNGHFAAEIRLPEAINRNLLCPFQYFGVSDTVDLDKLKWTRGGYEVSELENVYVYSHEVAKRRAAQIVTSVQKYVTDMNEVKGLGFCVSVKHAQFMSDFFNNSGIPSIALSGNSDNKTRETAKNRLISGEIRFIFVVDLYNEGVDIPEVNTILFLRPTESLTVFLQQLGRGLRLAEDKDCLTVLDFIGRANKKYNYEEKFAALLDNTKHSVRQEMQNGFMDLPKGCYIKLEKKASANILENIKQGFSTRNNFISRIQSFEEDSGQTLTLAQFLHYYRMDPRTLYGRKTTFSRLCVQANTKPDFKEPLEEKMSTVLMRFSSIDSRRWISFLQENIEKITTQEADGNAAMAQSLSDGQKRMLQMFYITVFGKCAKTWDDTEVIDNFTWLHESPTMMHELLDLLAFRYSLIDIIDEPVQLDFDCPLDLHCNYTRDQLLIAMDYMTPGNIREGVKWLPEKKIDVLMVTLNKSAKEYSPSTMYNDYSINDHLFHWQSQSTTSEDSPTGQRYIHHIKNGSHVLLFVREFKNELGGAAPYTFLGPVSYVSHEGSRPMNIVWKLDKPIPAKYIRTTNQLEVG